MNRYINIAMLLGGLSFVPHSLRFSGGSIVSGVLLFSAILLIFVAWVKEKNSRHNDS